jgi:putative copper resistance protein D
MIDLPAAVRFFHLAASVLLVGRFAFTSLILRGRLQVRPVPPFISRFEELECRLTTIWLSVAWLTHITALQLQVAAVRAASAGVLNIGALVAFVADTRFGNVWLARAVLLCGLTLLCWVARRQLRTQQTGGVVVGLLLSSGALMLPAWSGHAAAIASSIFSLEPIADAVHLLASGIWLGALLPLTLFLRLAARDVDQSQFTLIQKSIGRFSHCALASVALLVITGVANAWNLIAGVPQLFGTVYGKLLVGKLALLVPLLAVAACNLRSLKPRILRTVASGEEFLANLKLLRRNVALETAIGLAILLIVGQMSVTPPARHVQPDWPFSIRWDWTILEKAPKARAEAPWIAAWAAIGAGALLYGFVRRRDRVATGFIGAAALGYAAFSFYPFVTIDAYPVTYKRPIVSYNAISVANGSALYRDSGCAACHGPNGYGDGPNAPELNPKPADLTAPHANAHTAGDLYWWLSYGVKATSAMPGFSESLNEEERWDLINYMRALASGERARSLAPVIEEKAWLVAPDFSYTTNSGEAKTLKDHRGNRVVLLVLLNLQDTEQRLRELASNARELQSAGVEIIVVPNLIDQQFVADKLPRLIVDEGIREIGEVYKLFAASFNSEGTSGAIPHVEFLIDKQGYIRARWLPAEGAGWHKPGLLMQQIDALQKEKPSAPAPDEHVH